MTNPFPPQQITVSSDGCIMEYIGYDKRTAYYTYKYIHSEADIKTVLTIPFTKDILEKHIATNDTLKVNK